MVNWECISQKVPAAVWQPGALRRHTRADCSQACAAAGPPGARQGCHSQALPGRAKHSPPAVALCLSLTPLEQQQLVKCGEDVGGGLHRETREGGSRVEKVHRRVCPTAHSLQRLARTKAGMMGETRRGTAAQRALTSMTL